MENETRYQRVAREQRERQAATAERMVLKEKALAKASRAARKMERDARNERRYLEHLVSDHNHEMDH
jgi:hypothetical protein